ncbi:MAG: SDR family NAD(P)-dependent oxidoreductase [Pseudomonadota bacterium]
MSRWAGKSAVITGAGTGIGRAVSMELARAGAVVYVTALYEQEAQDVVDAIRAAGGRAEAAALDVTEKLALERVFKQVAEEHGSLDLVINNAGIMYVGEFLEMDDTFLETLIDVNMKAVALGTLYAYRIMKAQGHGMIANMASSGGLIPVGTMAAYSGSKHGVVGLTASVAGEAEAHGVVFKTICPGNVSSDMLSKAKTRGTNAETVLKGLPALMPAERAARIIVAGLSQTPRKIVFPFYAKMLGLAQRVWPEIGHKGAVRSIEEFRKYRNDAINQD